MAKKGTIEGSGKIVKIRNKKQGTIWEISDGSHLERLLKKTDEYELVEPEKSG